MHKALESRGDSGRAAEPATPCLAPMLLSCLSFVYKDRDGIPKGWNNCNTVSSGARNAAPRRCGVIRVASDGFEEVDQSDKKSDAQLCVLAGIATRFQRLMPVVSVLFFSETLRLIICV